MIETEGFDDFQAQAEQLIQALANFPQIAATVVGRAMDRALILLQGDAADYPEATADSTYRRTGTLGRLWAGGARVVKMEGSGAGFSLVGRVGNATPYGPYVQDPDRQAQMHRGRWRTTDQVVRDNAAGIQMILARAGDDIVARVAQEAR